MTRLLRRKPSSPVVQSLMEVNADLTRRLAEVCRENLRLRADLEGTFLANSTMHDKWVKARNEADELRRELREATS